MTKTSIRIELEKSDVTDLAHIFKAGQKIIFENGYSHYIHAEALIGVDQIIIRDLKNAEIYFLAPYPHFLSFVRCSNVIVGGQKAASLDECSGIRFLDAEND